MQKLLLTMFVLALCSTSVSADSQRPSIVNNVDANALTTTTIRVSWNTPWDNVGVQGYNIYRNGQYFNTIYNSTNYLDSNLSSGTQYQYSVVAFDNARNYSVLSATASATTQNGSTPPPQPPPTDTGNPNTPSGLRGEVISSSEIKLFWNKPSGSVSGYNLYRDGSYFKTVRDSTEYSVASLSSNREYRFAIVAFNGNQYSLKSSDVLVKTSSNGDNSTGGSVPNDYQLVFNDEFRQRSLDSSKWNSSYRWGPNWTINNEQQYYVDRISDPNFGHSPFEFDGENMTIVATKTPDYLRSKANNKDYLSGTLTTYQKFKMTYGYVEMRAKLPKGQGLWPAFWLLHNQENGKRPEIDVVELLGKQSNLAYQTYHYYDNWTLRSSPSYEVWGPDYSQSFHTFGMKWEPGLITWYIDGEATNSHSSGNVANEDMYLLVNLALGGSWGGNVDGSTPFPARFTIDYIRAYKRP